MQRTKARGVVMLAQLTVKTERLEAFLDYTLENLAVSRAFPGNLQFDILVDAAAPETVCFYEVWETPEAQQAYMAWRTQAGDLTKLLSFLVGAPRFTALHALAG